eukprot:CAMPEP_0194029330 /NCGR_PEP_ID=MMETSP0009_2-20130614/3081_1 /TAXON_ID=210454 /ORGANISM="Grammatophora oceanica, Strain CCMP 410" /LENGTH=142 /DNA_ID=CAMNT_0038668961 /DNA_START=154 /DNA_END=582 /DNA_ORIENTATION=+
MARTTRSSARLAAAGKGKPAAPAKKVQTAKKSKPSGPKKAKKKEAAAVAAEKPEAAGGKIVTIEDANNDRHSKLGASKISKAIGSKATVEINKEKPGRGNFVVRVSGTEEPVVELLGMKRPFPALKALDMDEVSENVLKALE